jgi:hypothetical protein
MGAFHLRWGAGSLKLGLSIDFYEKDNGPENDNP